MRTIHEFESAYRKDYEQELASCDRWIKWCEEQNDTHGMNFHQGMRSAHVFNNIKMEQLLRTLKQEALAPLTVAEAQRRQVCRICKLNNRPSPGNPLVLNYGEEYAHEQCLKG